MKRLSLIVAALLLALHTGVFASGPGTTTGELLKVPIGARAVGMGEAYTAMADDSSSLEWNPAGLAEANQKEASFMHSSLLENVNYEHLAYINPGSSYSAGASMSYLGFGNIAGYNNTGDSIGNQSAYSYIFNGGVATTFHERFSVGLTGSLLHEKLAQDSASTLAANLGALYDVAAQPFQTNYRLGMSVLNLGPGLKYVSDREPLPRQIKFGAAAMHVHTLPLNLTADVSVPNDNTPYLSLGSEYWFRDLLALRLGYTGANTVSNGFRFGLGLKIREILFDYAYGSFGDFGATHRIEIALRFGERSHQMNQEERAILKDAKANEKEGNYAQAIINYSDLLNMDSDNSKVMKQMIVANEALNRKRLNEAVAQANSDANAGIPSPEEAATAAMIEGQHPSVASAGALPPVAPGDDPLNLEGLPDATNLQTTSVVPNSGIAPEPTVPDTSLPAHEVNPPKEINAPAAIEKPSTIEAPAAVETTPNHASKVKEVGAPVVPTMAPVDNGPADNTGITPTPPPSQDNTSSGNGTLVNPNDIYGN